MVVKLKVVQLIERLRTKEAEITMNVLKHAQFTLR